LVDIAVTHEIAASFILSITDAFLEIIFQVLSQVPFIKMRSLRAQRDNPFAMGDDAISWVAFL